MPMFAEILAHDPDPTAVDALVARMRPILAGQHPGLQMGAIADMAAIWLAGHPPEIRAELRDILIAMVDELVPPNAAMIRGQVGTEL